MERVEGKRGEVGGEREGSLGEKLRREALVGRKGGPCTPVLSWRLSAPRYKNIKQKLLPNTVSVRKLGAALWEFQHYDHHSQMRTGFDNGVTSGADSSRRRRSCHLSHEEKGHDLSHFPGHAHPFSTSAEQVASYVPAFVPASPARIGGSLYGLKTSTQLLKVLNRIWSLEEQQVSNIALIKALKAELDHTLVNINDIIQQRNAEQGEMDELIKQFAEDSLVRKKKERNRIEAAVKSAKAELDDERKLRKRSETMHRKLAYLSEVKLCLSNTLKDLETEKRSRILLEVLCDEFAIGVKGYEQEMHALKQKSDKTSPGRTEHDDRLILHISESWLDERMQMQNDAQSGRMEKSSTAEKLKFEIESFLQHRHKHVNADAICGDPLAMGRRSSIESMSFSAPRVVAGDEEDSIDSDELNRPTLAKETKR